MGKPPPHIFPDIDSLAEEVICTFQRHRDLSAADGRPFHVALSGGSTPLAIFRKLKDAFPPEEWSGTCLWWGDERCVPPDDPDSNYGNAKKLLIDPLQLPAEQVFRIRGEEDPREEAHRYGKLLLDRLPLENGIPVFDWIWLGLGTDGHTASLFPGEPSLWHAPVPCTVASHPLTGQVRITLTGRLINAARRVTFLVTGIDKAPVVKEILHKEGRFREYPAALVNPVSGELEWYLDSGAASMLQGLF